MINFEQGDLVALRYEIKTYLGEGRFAKVYKVFDNKLKTEKALKIFHDNNENALKSLISEASILSKLNHPNIVRIYDYGSRKNFIFQDMEFIAGKELNDYIYNSQLTFTEKVKLAIELTKGIKYAHSKNVIHHDLKPQNILVTNDKKIKITDFGIAEQLEGEEQKTFTYGSKAYMSPEKRWDKKTSYKTDIFSLGIIFHEIFHNEYPFSLSEDETPNYNIPLKLARSKEKIDKVIYDCLTSIPDDRPNASEILKSLKIILYEKNPTPIMKLTKLLHNINPINITDPKSKKDLILISICLMIMFLIVPFFYNIINKYHPKTRKISTRFPQSKVYTNFDNQQIRPPYMYLKKGDSIQLRKLDGSTLFNYIYKGEKYLYFHIDKENNIILNNKIVGKHIKSRKDLPLKNNLEIIQTEIHLSKNDLKNQKNKNLIISIGENIGQETINNLPQNMIYLDINKNKKIQLLKNSTNLYNLKIFDSSNREINNLFNFSSLKKLKQLNVQNTGIENSYVFRLLKKLNVINLSDNNLTEISGIKNMPLLRNVSLNNNPHLQDISPLLNKKNLDNVSLIKNNNISQNQKKQLKDNLNSKKIIHYINTNQFLKFEKIIFWLFFINLLILSFFFSRLFIRQMKKITAPPEIPTNNIISSKNFNKNEELKKLNDNINKDQLALPKGENALDSLIKIATNSTPDNSTKKKYSSVCKKCIKKIKHHLKKKEYEPAFLIASSAYETTKKQNFKNLLTKSKKKLVQNNHRIKFIKIKGGTFQMGDFEKKSQNTPLHQVNISNFKISETLVTNKQFCNFLNIKKNQKDGGIQWINLNSPYSKIEVLKGKYIPKEGYDAFPVFNVSWYGAQRFCKWVGGRLPTEAEYEYTARNKGENIAYTTGNNINNKQANYLVDKNDQNWHSALPVKSFKPNPLKVYDLCGNLLEWCFDNYDADYYNNSSVENPTGPQNSSLSNGKVVRGGAWCFEKERMKTYRRGAAKPNTRNNFIGFRIVK